MGLLLNEEQPWVLSPRRIAGLTAGCLTVIAVVAALVISSRRSRPPSTTGSGE